MSSNIPTSSSSGAASPGISPPSITTRATTPTVGLSSAIAGSSTSAAQATPDTVTAQGQFSPGPTLGQTSDSSLPPTPDAPDDSSNSPYAYSNLSYPAYFSRRHRSKPSYSRSATPSPIPKHLISGSTSSSASSSTNDLPILGTSGGGGGGGVGLGILTGNGSENIVGDSSGSASGSGSAMIVPSSPASSSSVSSSFSYPLGSHHHQFGRTSSSVTDVTIRGLEGGAGKGSLLKHIGSRMLFATDTDTEEEETDTSRGDGDTSVISSERSWTVGSSEGEGGEEETTDGTDDDDSQRIRNQKQTSIVPVQMADIDLALSQASVVEGQQQQQGDGREAGEESIITPKEEVAGMKLNFSPSSEATEESSSMDLVFSDKGERDVNNKDNNNNNNNNNKEEDMETESGDKMNNSVATILAPLVETSSSTSTSTIMSPSISSSSSLSLDVAGAITPTSNEGYPTNTTPNFPPNPSPPPISKTTTTSPTSTTKDSRTLLREQLRRNEILEKGGSGGGKKAGKGKGRRGEGQRKGKQREIGSLSPHFMAHDMEDISDPSSSSTFSLSLFPAAPVPFSKRRKYYVLSSAGKPIFCSDADEEEESTATRVGVIQAIVSIFADEGDMIRHINGPDRLRITFLVKPPLYLVCCSEWGEPESVLRYHLDYLYYQIISIVSLTQIDRIFSKQANFDLRRMLGGTENFLYSMVDTLQYDLSIMSGSLEVFKIDSQTRAELAKAMSPQQTKGTTTTKNLLYVLLVAEGKTVMLLRPKKHSVHPADLHLILNTLSSSTTLKSSESWIPICLPKFNSSGFLHAFVSFLDDDEILGGGGNLGGDPERDGAAAEGQKLKKKEGEAITDEKGGGQQLKDKENEKKPGPNNWMGTGRQDSLRPETEIGLVMVSGGQDGVAELKEMKESIVQKLQEKRLLKAVADAVPKQRIALADLAVPGLRHFVYKSRQYVQMIQSGWEGPYQNEINRRRLITLYQRVHHQMHLKPISQMGAQPAKLVYLRTESESLLGWTTQTFELYLALSPMLPKTAAVSAAHAVTEWVKGADATGSDLGLFLTISPSF